MKYILLFSFFFIGAIHTSIAQCNDVEITDGLIQYNGAEYDHLKSVGAFVGGGNCTATFIKTSENNNAPAYVISNGHCVGLLDNNRIIVNSQATENYKITFNAFENTESSKIVVDVINIEYATMKGRDIAIFRLNKTIGEMQALGFKTY